MSTSTLTLPCTRFVRQVSGGCARSKYSFQAMQTDLLDELKRVPWQSAKCPLEEVTTVTNKVTQTDRVIDEQTGQIVKQSTYTAFIDDRYDAYKQGGDANTADATMCGYMGMVAYYFRMPSGNSVPVTSIKLRLAASRYLRSGLRVVVAGTSAGRPDTSWANVRGEYSGAIRSASTPAQGVVGVSSWGFLGQPDAGTLVESRARDGELELKASDFPYISELHSYSGFFVYVSIEDPEDYWDLYEARTPRYYSIEGSATLVPAACTVTFSGEVSAPAASSVTAIGNAYHGAWHFGGTSDLAAWDTGECSSGDATTYLAAQNTAFGNFLKMRSFESGMMLDTGNGGIGAVHRLMRFRDFPRKDCFSGAVPLTNGAFVPIADLGVFAVNPSILKMVDKPGDSSKKVFGNDGGALGESVGFCLWEPGTGNAHTTSVKPAAYGDKASTFKYLRFRSTVRLVPGGLACYTRMAVQMTKVVELGYAFFGTWKINIWRTHSPDALGYFRLVALSALLSHQELFAEAPGGSVSATIAGTGEVTGDYNLAADAQFLGTVDVPGNNGDTSTVEIPVPKLVGGDMLIFAPALLDVYPAMQNFDETVTIDSVTLR